MDSPRKTKRGLIIKFPSPDQGPDGPYPGGGGLSPRAVYEKTPPPDPPRIVAPATRLRPLETVAA